MLTHKKLNSQEGDGPQNASAHSQGKASYRRQAGDDLNIQDEFIHLAA